MRKTNMIKKEIMNNGFRKKKDAKITIIMAFFLAVIFTISIFNAIPTCSATTSSSSSLTTTEKIFEERFVDNESIQLIILTYYRNTIIHINIAVLLQSNSSVNIYPPGKYPDDFSPQLTNTTLAPGESFAESYTFVVGVANGLIYLCKCTLVNSNATVLWWYEVLYSAKPDNGFIGIDFSFISGAVVLSTMAMVFIAKRKSNKKNE